MTPSLRTKLTSLVVAALLGASTAGCSSSSETSLSKEEQANFKGGPMPAGYNGGPSAGPPAKTGG